MNTDLENAKARVAKIFDALAPGHQAAWQEKVSGGLTASTSILNGELTADINTSGENCEYSVYVGRNSIHYWTLASGCYGNSAQS